MKKARGTAIPVNLVVIGEFETLISAFAARWDETEIDHAGHMLEDGAGIPVGIAVPLFTGQLAVSVRPQSGRGVAAAAGGRSTSGCTCGCG